MTVGCETGVPRTHRGDWTIPGTQKMLMDLWPRHELSLANIADQINKAHRTSFTKWAISQKSTRLGLPSRPNPIHLIEVPSTRSRRSPAQLVALAQFSTASPAPSDIALDRPREERFPRECAWPLNEKGKRRFVFCCAPITGRSPYCEAHGAKAYLKPQAFAATRTDTHHEH